MPKSNQPDKKSRSQPDLPRLIELDEAIFGPRISERMSPESMDRQLEDFIEKLKEFNIIASEDEWDEENYEYEDFDPEEFEPKLIAIFDDTNFELTLRNHKKYLSYLNKALQRPCILTGNQEFSWEEYYIFGGGTQKQHEKQRKTKASYMDKFKLISLSQDISEDEGIMVEVERVSDRKKFTLPLWQLEEAEPTTKNYQLIDDYVTWFENYHD